MTLKHVLKHFSKTEVQEDKTHPTPPLKREGVKVSCAEHTVKDLSSNRLTILTTLKHKLDCFAYTRNDDLCAEHTVKDLSSNRLTILTTLKHKLDCFAYTRNDDLCAEHTEKHLFSYSPIHLFTFKKAAFTKPSRGTSEARDEFQSTKMLNFRCWNERCRLMRGAAFTLAEVLITLAIIGVVAIMTLTVVIDKINDLHFKNAYKKAYFDLSQVVSEAIANNEFTRQGHSNIYVKEELNIFKNKFKVIKDCPFGRAFECWKDADRLCTNSCGANAPQSVNSSFIDASGRSWCSFFLYESIYLVDTNGMKEPNRFGKDRWVFCFLDKDGNCTNYADKYVKVGPMLKDIKTKSNWCTYPPCNYYSWLYE